MRDTTNATTATAATQSNALPLRQMHLIGIVGPVEARRALLRTANGDIVHVSTGTRLRQGTVVAISDSAVILGTRTGTRQFEMPRDTSTASAA
ncbi:hypothetical protein [uncultured Tateyamaria sp.]|uniref:hypothetical protein n=1 Tax=uncultured Tateyamaria sp. TaxID=455651 RepID=UPI002624F9B2|nr:hypothetical protein [uncultured Tateyamaria sp.]